MADAEQGEQAQFLVPSPGGAYHGIKSWQPSRLGQFVRQILGRPESPRADEAWVCDFGIVDDTGATALDLALDFGWVERQPAIAIAPQGRLEDLLPGILPALARTQQILLADDQGFVIGSVGFDAATSNRVAAFSADVTSLRDRHKALLETDLALDTSALGLIGAGGESRLGLWPLYIREKPFVLAIKGEPLFNTHALRELIWVLLLRYQESGDEQD